MRCDDDDAAIHTRRSDHWSVYRCGNDFQREVQPLEGEGEHGVVLDDPLHRSWPEHLVRHHVALRSWTMARAGFCRGKPGIRSRKPAPGQLCSAPWRPALCRGRCRMGDLHDEPLRTDRPLRRTGRGRARVTGRFGCPGRRSRTRIRKQRAKGVLHSARIGPMVCDDLCLYSGRAPGTGPRCGRPAVHWRLCFVEFAAADPWWRRLHLCCPTSLPGEFASQGGHTDRCAMGDHKAALVESRARTFDQSGCNTLGPKATPVFHRLQRNQRASACLRVAGIGNCVLLASSLLQQWHVAGYDRFSRHRRDDLWYGRAIDGPRRRGTVIHHLQRAAVPASGRLWARSPQARLASGVGPGGGPVSLVVYHCPGARRTQPIGEQSMAWPGRCALPINSRGNFHRLGLSLRSRRKFGLGARSFGRRLFRWNGRARKPRVARDQRRLHGSRISGHMVGLQRSGIALLAELACDPGSARSTRHLAAQAHTLRNPKTGAYCDRARRPDNLVALDLEVGRATSGWILSNRHLGRSGADYLRRRIRVER